MYMKKGEQWQTMDVGKGSSANSTFGLVLPAVGGVSLIAGAADLYSLVEPSSKQSLARVEHSLSDS
jgi:hypothetical protein